VIELMASIEISISILINPMPPNIKNTDAEMANPITGNTIRYLVPPKKRRMLILLFRDHQ
jgi:hypothetical protein